MGIMKKLILICTLLFSFCASAQILYQPTTYGYKLPRLVTDSLFAVPTDTFSVPTALRTYPHVARKGVNLYFWNTSTLKWDQFGAGAGTVTSVSTTNGYSITSSVATGTSTPNITIGVDSATLFLYGLRRKDSLTTTNLLGYVTRTVLADTASAIRSSLGVGISDGDKGDITISNTATTFKVDSLLKPVYPNKYDLSEASHKINSASWSQVSTSVKSDWWDGVGIPYHSDTLFIMGGWRTGPTVTDSIFYSIDGGVTFTGYSGKLPMAMHTFAYVYSNGYHYICGSDYLATATQQKTVWRSPDLKNWTVMTSNYGGSTRLLGSAWADELGNLYWGFGQSGLDAGTGLNDIWKSTNFGTTWTQIATSISVAGYSFGGMNVSNQVKYFNGRVWRVGGGVYDDDTPGDNTYDKRVYSADIRDLTKWVRETDLPFTTGSQYMGVAVWDGKIWVHSGYNGSANTNEIAYIDKNGSNRLYYNYIDNLTAGTLSVTHAPAFGVFRDKLYRILGNTTNDAYVLARGTFVDSFTVRNDFRVGPYSTYSQTLGAQATIIGNNIIRGTTNNTIKRMIAADNGTYQAMKYNEGWWVGLDVNSSVGTDVSDTTNSRIRVNLSGELSVSDEWSYDKGNYKLQVKGAAHISGLVTLTDYASVNKSIAYFDESGNVENASAIVTGDGTNLGVGITPVVKIQAHKANTSTLTDLTGVVSGNLIGLSTTYALSSYSPSFVWSTNDNNPTIPKALFLERNLPSGSSFEWYVSNDYAAAPSILALKLEVDGGTFAGWAKGAINAYDATGWNGSSKFATEDAVRDKIETLGGSGTVTDFVFTDANGFDGTVTNSTTTPTLSLTTTVTDDQIMFSNSGAIAGSSALTYDGSSVAVGSGTMVFPSTTGYNGFSSGAGASNGVNITNTSTTGYIQLLLAQTTSNYGGFFKWNSAYVGNYTGTSVPFASTFQVQAGNANQQDFVISSGSILWNNGQSAGNLAIRVSSAGIKLGTNADLHTDGTAFVDITAGTTSLAQIRYRAGVAPSSPNDGESWYENTNDRLMFRQNATSVELIGASAVNSTSPTAPDRTITVQINGTTYYIHAKTTND